MTSPHASADFGRGGMMTAENLAKLERLTKLREDARLLELELKEDMGKRDPVGSPKQLSNANTPRGKTGMSASRLPRRSKAAAASTNRAVGLVKDQIVANYNTVQLYFNRNDTDNTGKTDLAALLAIMAQCNIPMTKAQATEIMQLLEPDEQGRILYRDFLAIFHVQMPRLDGDIVRPFTGIHAASAGLPGTRRQTPQFTAKSEGGRPKTKALSEAKNPNLRDRPTTSMRAALVYGGNISAARFALIAQLNEFVHDNKQKLEAMFEVSDMESSGKVSKFEAVRIMTSAGFPLNIEELEDALEVIAEKAPKGYVEYKAVLTKLSSLTFDMPEIFESLTSVHFAPTHLYRVVGGRIRDCYPRFLACLSEEDSEGNGVVSRAALLRILKGVHLEISEQALNEVIRASGVKPNLRHQINLHHFISRFVPSHRPPSEGRYAELAERARVPREINNAPAMNPDQLLEKLKEKMEDHIKYPRDMFLKLDTDKDGTLTKQELEKAFLHFNLYPKASDVDALFDTVDVYKKGRIGYGEFLSMLVPRGDNKPSMYHDSFKSYMRKGSFYSLVPQGVAPVRLGTNGKLTAVGRLSVRDIQQVMRKKLSTQHQNMKVLLDQRDQDATGFVSKNLLLQVLRKLDVFITIPQLEEVLEAQGITSHGDSVRISDFMAKFLITNAGNATDGGGAGWQTDRPSTKAPVDKTELLNRIRSSLRGRWEDVQKAFFEEQDQAADFKVGKEEVARILARFGVPVTQDQGRALFDTLDTSIDYLDFVRLLDLGSRRSRLPTAAGRQQTSLSRKSAQVEMISPSRRMTGKA